MKPKQPKKDNKKPLAKSGEVKEQVSQEKAFENAINSMNELFAIARIIRNKIKD